MASPGGAKAPGMEAGEAGWAAGLRRRDGTALAARGDVLDAHTYEGDWFNNATFVFPSLGAVGTLIGWAVTGATELFGISMFLFVVTGLMLPLVWLTWRRTATVIVLRRSGIEALHQGEPLQFLAWDTVLAVRRVETMGNVRWYVLGAEEQRLTLEGEIADLEDLLARVRDLAGLAGEHVPLDP